MLAGSAIALLLPAVAGAKFTCQDRGAPLQGIVLRGLPAQPVARHTYTLTVTRPPLHNANPTPYLGTTYCGNPTRHKTGEPTAGWFQHIRGNPRGVYSLDVRFPHPGPWAVSYMDLDGTFHDAGLHQVEPAPHRTTPAAATRPSAATWLGAGVAALAVAGFAFFRRKHA